MCVSNTTLSWMLLLGLLLAGVTSTPTAVPSWITDDSCAYANDSVCNEGNPQCAPYTDCTDCGNCYPDTIPQAHLYGDDYGPDESILFPFGPKAGDNVMHQDDDGSESLTLPIGFRFFDIKHTLLFVNTNGVLSFETAVPQFAGEAFPVAEFPIIAPFWADIDTTIGCKISMSTRTCNAIYYQLYTNQSNPAFLQVRDTTRFYDAKPGFNPTLVFIATWYTVAHFNQTDYNFGTSNTFQAVLVTDGTHSYAIFVYPYHGVSWIAGDSNQPYIATVGFDSGDFENFYELPVSRQAAVATLANSVRVFDITFKISDVTLPPTGRPTTRTPTASPTSPTTGKPTQAPTPPTHSPTTRSPITVPKTPTKTPTTAIPTFAPTLEPLPPGQQWYPCASHPCKNGATCQDLSSSMFVCVCIPGWTGKLCDGLDDVCTSDPCQHGGLCSSVNGLFLCDCPSGTTGDRCENPQAFSAIIIGPNTISACESDVSFEARHTLAMADTLAAYVWGLNTSKGEIELLLSEDTPSDLVVPGVVHAQSIDDGKMLAISPSQLEGGVVYTISLYIISFVPKPFRCPSVQHQVTRSLFSIPSMYVDMREKTTRTVLTTLSCVIRAVDNANQCQMASLATARDYQPFFQFSWYLRDQDGISTGIPAEMAAAVSLTTSTLIIPPFILVPNTTYRFNVNVTMNDGSVITVAASSLMVKPSLYEIQIKGGLVVETVVTQDYTIDASSTYDPDYPEVKSAKTVFWKCKQLSVKYGADCGAGEPSFYASNFNLVIRQDTLIAGRMYAFYLVLDQGLPKETKSSVVTINAIAPPMVANPLIISTITADLLVNVDDNVCLTLAVHPGSIAQTNQLGLQWKRSNSAGSNFTLVSIQGVRIGNYVGTLWTPDKYFSDTRLDVARREGGQKCVDDLDATIAAGLVRGRKAQNGLINVLLIPANMLVAGVVYGFRFDAFVQKTDPTLSGGTSDYTHTIDVNSPPAGGTVEVSRSMGIAYETSFDIEAKFWTDTHTPITYEFFYAQGSNPPKLLKTSSQLATKISTFPEGNITIIINIRDNLGALTVVNTYIITTLSTLTKAQVAMLSQIDTFSNLQQTGDIVSGIATAVDLTSKLPVSDQADGASQLISAIRVTVQVSAAMTVSESESILGSVLNLIAKVRTLDPQTLEDANAILGGVLNYNTDNVVSPEWSAIVKDVTDVNTLVSNKIDQKLLSCEALQSHVQMSQNISVAATQQTGLGLVYILSRFVQIIGKKVDKTGAQMMGSGGVQVAFPADSIKEGNAVVVMTVVSSDAPACLIMQDKSEVTTPSSSSASAAAAGPPTTAPTLSPTEYKRTEVVAVTTTKKSGTVEVLLTTTNGESLIPRLSPTNPATLIIPIDDPSPEEKWAAEDAIARVKPTGECSEWTEEIVADKCVFYDEISGVWSSSGLTWASEAQDQGQVMFCNTSMIIGPTKFEVRKVTQVVLHRPDLDYCKNIQYFYTVPQFCYIILVADGLLALLGLLQIIRSVNYEGCSDNWDITFVHFLTTACVGCQALYFLFITVFDVRKNQNMWDKLALGLFIIPACLSCLQCSFSYVQWGHSLKRFQVHRPREKRWHPFADYMVLLYIFNSAVVSIAASAIAFPEAILYCNIAVCIANLTLWLFFLGAASDVRDHIFKFPLAPEDQARALTGHLLVIVANAMFVFAGVLAVWLSAVEAKPYLHLANWYHDTNYLILLPSYLCATICGNTIVLVLLNQSVNDYFEVTQHIKDAAGHGVVSTNTSIVPRMRDLFIDHRKKGAELQKKFAKEAAAQLDGEPKDYVMAFKSDKAESGDMWKEDGNNEDQD